MISIAIITTIVILTTLIVVFLVEFSAIVPILKSKKKMTFVDTYALINSGFIILAFAAIHKYLFTAEIFTYSLVIIMANILCFAFYQLLRIFQAKVEQDSEREKR